MTDQGQSSRPAGRIRDQQNFVGGLGLLGFVLAGWIASDRLALGTLNALGPGMLPRVVLVLIALVGIALIVGSFVSEGPRVRLADFTGLIATVALVVAAIVLGALAAAGGLRELFGLPAFAAAFCILYAALLVGLLVHNMRAPGWLDRSGLRGPIFVVGGLIAFALTVREVGLLLAAPLLAIISGAASHETRFGELIAFAIVMTLLCIGVFKYALNLPIPVLVIPGVVYF